MAIPSETPPEFWIGVGTDLVVSSTIALDATHDQECYATEFGRAQFCTRSGHAKRRKRQEYAGRRTCSRGDRQRERVTDSPPSALATKTHDRTRVAGGIRRAIGYASAKTM